MSQMPAVARPSARTARRTETQRRPQLVVVPAAPPAPRRLPFVLLCSFLLAGGLMALLFLNMALAQGSYALHNLQAQSTQLDEDAGMLRESLAGQEAPAQLATRALKLGMVPGAAPAFLRLPDGQVLGVPQPAGEPTAGPSSSGPAATSGGTPTAQKKAAEKKADKKASQKQQEASQHKATEKKTADKKASATSTPSSSR